jgi:hypothetical protein
VHEKEREGGREGKKEGGEGGETESARARMQGLSARMFATLVCMRVGTLLALSSSSEH